MTVRALSHASIPSMRVIEGASGPKPRVTAWILYLIVIALAFFGLIYSQTRLNQSALEIQEIESLIAAEHEIAEDLSLQVARLRSPARVQPAAVDLGMVFPSFLETLTTPGVVAVGERMLPERTQILSAP